MIAIAKVGDQGCSLPFMMSTAKRAAGTVKDIRFERFLELNDPAIDVHIARMPVIMREIEQTFMPVMTGMSDRMRPLKNSTGSES